MSTIVWEVHTLLLSINAYAQPNHHKAFEQDQKLQAKDTTKNSENDLSSQLTKNNWHIINIAKEPEFNIDERHWIFNFASNGKYRGYGICNYLSGSYKTDNTGTFRISNLNGSNNHCDNTKDNEAKVFNRLLMVDSLIINGESLILRTNGQASIELKATNNQVNAAPFKKGHTENRVASTRSKKLATNKPKKSRKDTTKHHTKNKSSK